MAAGNLDVILCERGIRGAASSTRFTLDVGAIPLLKSETHLPVVVDPSHAAGRSDLVAAHASAAVAAGADGLLVEVHPDPQSALSDGAQSLRPDAFHDLMRGLALVARAMGRSFARPPQAPRDGAGWPLDALTKLREDIEAVDQELIQLIAQRVEIARHAGDVKRAAGIPVVDLAQESEVLERARPMAEAAGLPYREVRALLRGIIAVSRSAQRVDADPGQFLENDS
jgi:3-deoxy-7-phosphoheptulonate synthase